MLGDTSVASKGLAFFQLLTILAPPGDYLLHFRHVSDSSSGQTLPALLNVRLRGCMAAGEANMTSDAVSELGSNAALSPCQKCQPGSVSLDPLAAGGCMRCTDSMHADCSGDGLVPFDGYFQSHPRSPLVHRCVMAAACQASLRQQEMQRWARGHAAASVDDLEPDYQEYVNMQCADGYEVYEIIEANPWSCIEGCNNMHIS